MAQRLNLITLYREALHYPDKEKTENSENSLALDYFDALEIKEFSISESILPEFMGLSVDKSMNVHDVAMHSLPLYHTDESVKEYIKNAYYGDPLSNDKYPYLGIILVYITPEVITRIKNVENREKSSDKSKIFYKDIHMMMDSYVKDLEEDDFIYSIYYSLSIADFAIAIRGMYPESIFKITTLLRMRRYSFEQILKTSEGQEIDSLVLYKSYTIFSLGKQLISTSVKGMAQDPDTVVQDPEQITASDDEDSKNLFVLRCVLSSKYWNSLRKKDTGKKKHLFPASDIERLNGRYDVTFRMTERAFFCILPLLRSYKLDDVNSLDEIDTEKAGREKQLCDYLVNMIKSGYISHINERYVFKLDTENIKEYELNPEIKLHENINTILFTEEINEESIKAVKQRIDNVYQKIVSLNTTRTSIVYSIHLLDQLVITFYSLNGNSDTRIYCSIILHQIGAVLDGLEEYYRLIERTENRDLIEAIDGDLKRAVEAMNAFSKYLFESTLQNLQTPNYNLESHTSVEKLLTAYSRFLQRLIEWYGETDISNKIYGRTQKYIPVMVPQPLDSILSIKAIFYRLNPGLNHFCNKLLVVHCPSFYDLTEFEHTIGILFHEVAHFFRYEDRSIRNDMILHYSSYLLLDIVATTILSDIKKRVRGLAKPPQLTIDMADCLAEAYYDAMYKQNARNADYNDMNLLTLIDWIGVQYQEFVKAATYLEELQTTLQIFLSSEPAIPSSKERKLMVQLTDFYDQLMPIDRRIGFRVDIVLLRKNIIKIISELESYEKEAENFIETRELRNLIENLLIDIDEDGNVFRNDKNNKTPSPLREIESQRLKRLREKVEMFHVVTMFYRRSWELLFDKMRDAEGELLEDVRKIQRYYNLDQLIVGRKSVNDYMGIFFPYLAHTRTESQEMLDTYLAIYREATSDLFMVKVLGLTLFGYTHLLVGLLPMEGRIGDTYIRRFIMVMYAMKQEKVKLGRETWEGIWVDLFENICEYITKNLKIVLDMKSEETGEFVKKVKDYYDWMNGFNYDKVLPEKDNLDKSVNVEKRKRFASYVSQKVTYLGVLLQKEVEEHFRNESGEDRQSLDPSVRILEKVHRRLMTCKYMFEVYLSVYDEFKNYVNVIERFSSLAEDLQRGNNNLDLLHKEFEQSDLWAYCKLIAQRYNGNFKDKNEDETEDVTEVAEREFNQRMIEFVYDMHYDMLFHYGAETYKQGEY